LSYVYVVSLNMSSTGYVLKIKVLDENAALKEKYAAKIASLDFTKLHQDSGFDLFCVADQKFQGRSIMNKLGLGVACAVEKDGKPCAYYMYPRSSISKTGLRLANSVGIIDSGYRGELIAMVDNVYESVWPVDAGMRLFQICTPDLSPFSRVELVDELDATARGAGGFGSTGK
jgi:dUTP pyrophosphatase